MTRYRLKAKLKVARPQNSKQDSEQREALKKTLQTTSTCWASTICQVRQDQRPIRYFAQDESQGKRILIIHVACKAA